MSGEKGCKEVRKEEDGASRKEGGTFFKGGILV